MTNKEYFKFSQQNKDNYSISSDRIIKGLADNTLQSWIYYSWIVYCSVLAAFWAGTYAINARIAVSEKNRKNRGLHYFVSTPAAMMFEGISTLALEFREYSFGLTIRKCFSFPFMKEKKKAWWFLLCSCMLLWLFTAAREETLWTAFGNALSNCGQNSDKIEKKKKSIFWSQTKYCFY